jgi:hypothetical protein
MGSAAVSGEEIVRDFLREFSDLTLTREQQDRLAEMIEQANDYKDAITEN